MRANGMEFRWKSFSHGRAHWIGSDPWGCTLRACAYKTALAKWFRAGKRKTTIAHTLTQREGIALADWAAGSPLPVCARKAHEIGRRIPGRIGQGGLLLLLR